MQILNFKKDIQKISKKILVYVKINDTYSYILEIKNSKMSYIDSDTIKTYKNKNASDPSHLKEVLSDIKKTLPF